MDCHASFVYLKNKRFRKGAKIKQKCKSSTKKSNEVKHSFSLFDICIDKKRLRLDVILTLPKSYSPPVMKLNKISHHNLLETIFDYLNLTELNILINSVKNHRLITLVNTYAHRKLANCSSSKVKIMDVDSPMSFMNPTITVYMIENYFSEPSDSFHSIAVQMHGKEFTYYHDQYYVLFLSKAIGTFRHIAGRYEKRISQKLDFGFITHYTHLAEYKDGNYLAVFSFDKVHLLNVCTFQTEITFDKSGMELIYSKAYDKFILSSDLFGILHIFDNSHSLKENQLTLFNENVRMLSLFDYSPNCLLSYSSHCDDTNSIHVIDINKEKVLFSIQIHDNEIIKQVFYLKEYNNKLIAGFTSTYGYLWNIHTQECIRMISFTDVLNVSYIPKFRKDSFVIFRKNRNKTLFSAELLLLNKKSGEELFIPVELPVKCFNELGGEITFAHATAKSSQPGLIKIYCIDRPLGKARQIQEILCKVN